MRINKCIFLDELQSSYLSHYKDLRSVEKWCEKKNVPVLVDDNKKFVYDEPFMLAYYAKATNEQKIELKKIMPWVDFVIEEEVNEKAMTKNQLNKSVIVSAPKKVKAENLQPLVILPDKQVTGLYVCCQKCCVDSKSDLSKPYKNCSHPLESQVFKAKIHIKGTKNKNKSKNLIGVRDVDEAIRLVEEFRQEIYSGFNSNESAHGVDSGKSLKRCMKMYIDYLFDKQKDKNKKSKHTRDVEYTFNSFLDCLLQNKILPTLNVELLNKKHAEMFNGYLISKYKYHGATVNNKMRKFTSFVIYLNKNGFQIFNPFIHRVTENKSKDYITADEFYKLLEYIPNGERHYYLNTGEKKLIYFPWLADGIELALRTGLRREEVCHLKFNDIVYVDNIPTYFFTENLKVNNKNVIIHKDDRQMKSVPITKKLFALLEKLGLEKYRNTDTYILAPEDPRKRTTLMDNLTKGFTQYYKQLFAGKKCLKSLRSTYITRLHIFTLQGNQTNKLTNHAGMEVLLQHYISSSEMAKVYAKTFEVF